MLINRDELARKGLEGEISGLEDLNGVLRSMIKDVVETAMGAEMTGFLLTPGSDPGYRRNGYSQKELASKVGPVAIDVPRDRKSGFVPAIAKTRHKDIGGFEELIFSMYANGISTCDIQHHVKEIYGPSEFSVASSRPSSTPGFRAWSVRSTACFRSKCLGPRPRGGLPCSWSA